MNESHTEPTLQDVLGTVQDVLDTVNEGFTSVEGRLGNVEGRLIKLETDMTYVKSVMVTKDYLDDKLADLKGDMVLLMRKEDTKLRALLGILQKRQLISKEDAQSILSMDPFPQFA